MSAAVEHHEELFTNEKFHPQAVEQRRLCHSFHYTCDLCLTEVCLITREINILPCTAMITSIRCEQPAKKNCSKLFYVNGNDITELKNIYRGSLEALTERAEEEEEVEIFWSPGKEAKN